MEIQKPALKSELQAFAGQILQVHPEAALPQVAALIANQLRVLLCPHLTRGRKPIVSTTEAIRLFRSRELSGIEPAKRWSRIYPQAIPGYNELSPPERQVQQRILRDRARARMRSARKQRSQRGKDGKRSPETIKPLFVSS